MKVDLHCHTKATKNDGPGRNVSPELFAEKISLADIEVVAITNHNHFDLDQFNDLSAAVPSTQVWPGVELDVQGRFGQWHMLVIADPKNAPQFSESIRRIAADKPPKDCIWTFEEIWEEFSESDVLFVSHCHDKSPSITPQEIERIKEETNDDWRLYFEPKSLATLGIWSAHGYPMFLGSDVKNWATYEQCRFSKLRLKVDSFEQFLLLAKRDRQVVETLLNASSSQTFQVSPHQSVSFPIKLFNDVNVIFGQKGTGKTQIVRSIENECTRMSISVVSYYGGEKYNEYSKLIDPSDIARDAADFGRSDSADDLAFISSWSDALPSPLMKYVSWFSTRGNNAKKDNFKISESSTLPVPSKTLHEEAKRISALAENTVSDWPHSVVSRYLDEDDSKQLVSLLRILSAATFDDALAKFVNSESAVRANNILAKLKASIDRKSGTVSKPSSTGFLEFVANRIELKGRLDRIATTITPDVLSESTYLGTLEDKGELRLISQKRFLCKDSRTDEFLIGISKLKAWKAAFEKVAESIWTEKLPHEIAKLCTESQQSGISSANDFIGTSRFVTFSDGKTKYEPSDGEKGILVIERKLREDADVYLLDEPELGMSNLYVDKVIRTRVQELAAEGHIVVVSTHNANLAVRTLPYLSLYREHVDGLTFKTYIGNPFVNKLVSVEDPRDEKEWSFVSMTTLEGGPEAFYDRETIYEAGIHEN